MLQAYIYIAIDVRMISHFLWVFVLGVKDLTNKCMCKHAQSALEHDAIFTQ